MGWREEIATALGEWIAIEGGAGKPPRWQRIARAVRTGEPGGFAVDLRGSDIGPDQLDGLRLSGPEADDIEANGFSVSEAVQNGSLLTLRVVEFAEIADPHLWMLKQPPTFLIEALRDGIAGLGESPLATALAGRALGGTPAQDADPPGFHPAQGDAYRACLGSGLMLVWGPPGTGKTTVLKRAIGDLLARGDRVLLVSATNIAVDNALLGVVREKRHGPGDIVRVGPPHLQEVAEDASVSLPLMVRERLAEVAERRRTVEVELVAVRDRADQLAALDTVLAGFDPSAYFAALKLLRTPGQDLDSAQGRVTSVEARWAEAEESFEEASRAAQEAFYRSKATDASREQWEQVDELRKEQARVRLAAERREAGALLSEDTCGELREQLRELEALGSVARWRKREKITELQQRVRDAERHASSDRRAAKDARTTATTHMATLDTQIAALTAAIPYTPQQINSLAADVEAKLAAAERAQEACQAWEQESAKAAQAASQAQAAHDLAAVVDRKSWPLQYDRAQRLRPVVAADAARRPALEKQYAEVQEEYERFARNAQGEIIKGAKLVATTLARFRTNRAVFEGPYDVVLVDEAGAATLPEVLLATGKAGRAAVLLGDFMQLGPVIPPSLKEQNRDDIKRWLLPDIFQHCGITEPADAQAHPACVTLTEQHRFGPAVMKLANDLAYGGVLRGGSQARAARPADDPEIVLIDTDGLHELARAHLTGSRKGWWPAGSLISRALVELHRENGEDAGIVTPYGVQAEATLEALRDAEGSGQPLAEVGTAHRFQGREFDVVIFDTVEGADSRELWMALAHRQPGADAWRRNGVRLFNVAVTRVKTRLYIIGSWERIRGAKAGTALAQLAGMIGTPGVRRLQVKHLITPPHAPTTYRGEFGTTLVEVLSRHVEVTGIEDERDFYRTFTDQIRQARESLWLWAPWVANRLRSLLPELRDAVARGVRVTVFIRDDTDKLQRQDNNQSLIADLRAVVHTVVPMYVMHQKIAVIDERTVMLGSLNVLSQHDTREVMLTMRGSHFARKLLEHEHAEVFARPPKCGRCKGPEIEIRRYKQRNWVWRCYATACKTTSSGGSNVWTRDIRLPGSR